MKINFYLELFIFARAFIALQLIAHTKFIYKTTLYTLDNTITLI